ncbi:MAG: methyltransferase domain-containing protein [Ignavibacteriae bacterium]|nr:methyltransferase domain-containing protein [Ignavibacteria bacterium]MBI3364929.1 methyltransferase domain-containing protein [Ignavibacteriota bacterium]
MPEYEYGQKEPMENEAMVRTLDAQARAIWPQEKKFLKRIFTRPGLEALDVGCGTGEISSRIAREFSTKHVTGIDLAESHIRLAKKRFDGIAGVSFQQADATTMPFEDDTFDIALCRHMLQAIPKPLAVIKEMIRVIKPGGWLYSLAEDYGMLFFHPTKYDMDEFFGEYGGKAAAKAGSDLRHGRKMPSVLASLKCVDVEVNYLCIDTLRVDRNLLADIFVHWRDGFEEWISTNSGKSLEEVRNRFDDMIDCTRGKDSYAVWLIPSISARVTAEAKHATSRG